MQSRFMRSKTFRLWILCYLFMLLLPLVFSIMLYHNNAALLTRRAYDNGMDSVRQLGSVMDEQLKGVYRISDAICIQQDFVALKDYTLPFNARKYFDIHTKIKRLSVFGMHQDLISDIYLYQQNLQCLLDASHIYTMDNQYKRVIERSLGLDIPSFEALMTQSHLRTLHLSEDGTKCLLLQTIVTDYKRGTRPVTLILVLNMDTIRSLLEKTSANYEGQAQLMLGENAISSYVNTPEADSVTCVYPSEVSSLQYVLRIPKEVLFRDVDSSRMVFFYCIICTLVFGSLLAYAFAKHNYKPLRRLTLAVGPETAARDDFEMLANRMREMKEHCKEMQTEVERLSIFENAQTFSALLEGDLSMLDATQRARLRELFEGDVFVCASIIDDTAPCEGAARSALLRELTERFECQIRDACQCVIRYHGARIYAVFCFADGTNPYDAQLFVKQAAQRVLHDAQAASTLPALSIYVGDAQEHWEGISLSMKNALKAKEYTDFVAENERQVVLYNHMMYSTAISWKNTDIADDERRFASLMLTRNYAASRQLLQEIMAYYAVHDGLSLYQMRLRMFGVMNMVISVLREVETDLNAAFTTGGSPLERLMTVRTMQELEDVVIQIIEQLQLHSVQHAESSMGEKLEQITRFIETNYADPNLSVQMLADEFSLSLPYLSREFKNAKGTGVLSYINECRVRHAKQLMTDNSGIPLSEIARQVGYNSSQTLIRIFMRYEGITPGVFRAENG